METSPVTSGAAAAPGAPVVGAPPLHAHVSGGDLRRHHVTAARLHDAPPWLLREPNGRLVLETQAPTPERACSLAVARLDAAQRAARAWRQWEQVGYAIVQPVGPYHREGTPDEWWGRRARGVLWETHVVTWHDAAAG